MLYSVGIVAIFSDFLCLTLLVKENCRKRLGNFKRTRVQIK